MKFKSGKIVSVTVSSSGDESDAEERKELILTMDRDGASLTMVRNIACGRKPTQSCRKIPWFWADELCRHRLGCKVEPHAISCNATEGSVISITFGEGKATSVFSWSPPVPEGWEALEAIYHEMLDMWVDVKRNEDFWTDEKVKNLVMECEVVGIKFVDNWQERLADIENGSVLSLEHESDNEHDRNAIAVINSQGDRIGYLPKTRNAAIAYLFDNGRRMKARVFEIKKTGWKPNVKVHVFFNDQKKAKRRKHNGKNCDNSRHRTFQRRA